MVMVAVVLWWQRTRLFWMWQIMRSFWPCVLPTEELFGWWVYFKAAVRSFYRMEKMYQWQLGDIGVFVLGLCPGGTRKHLQLHLFVRRTAGQILWFHQQLWTKQLLHQVRYVYILHNGSILLCVCLFMLFPLYCISPATASPFCRSSAVSLSAFFNNGAVPCGCHEVGAESDTCETFGGQCQCKPNVIGRDCSQCATGYYGFPNCRREYLHKNVLISEWMND